MSGTEFLQQLINGVSLGAFYALIALGYTMVYGVLRFINFAHGDVFMIGAFAGYWLTPQIMPHFTRRDRRRVGGLPGACCWRWRRARCWASSSKSSPTARCAAARS